MKQRLQEPAPIGQGSVRADEVVTLREFGRRLGFARRAMCDLQRQGLRTTLVGRVKIVLGEDALTFFRRLAEQQASPAGPPADPVTADPVMADPVMADPITADPVTTDPVTTDPAEQQSPTARWFE